MSASEPNRPETPPPSREELAVAPTQVFHPDEPSSQLASLLDEYLAELQAGRHPNRAKLLAEHPELAVQLEQCLSGIEFIHQASVVRPTSEPLGQLGDFRIIREVGRGGMGVVYEAEQVSLKRRVALKVLRYGAASDSEAMQRFQREAETVATLHHTNIVPIFAIGCENGVNYYAMQFIEGRSLADFRFLIDDFRLSDDPTAPQSKYENQKSKIAGWGLQAAEALAHAHHRGVIHRDIKPSNLILDPDGRIWLTDFGLAKRMDDVSLSMAGAILGTPRYMSPEQAAATKNPVDHRTDIYSLGATLYELATGRPLFEADSPHLVITQILTTEPPAPRVVCPGLHRDFETIILKCLSKEPRQRYVTAQACADDLRAFVEGRAIKARRSTLAEQVVRWFKQQKRSVGIAAATVAATIFVVIGSLIAWQMREQSRLGYLTLNTPRDGNERAEVAEVLSLDDRPVGSPFTLPTKEPLALPEGAYRLRLTAPGKVSQTYLFDIAAGGKQTHEVGLVNETIGYAIPLRSPVGVEVVQRSPVAPRQEGRTSADAVRANDAQATKNADSALGFPVAERQGYLEPRLFVGPQDQSKPTMRCYSVNSQPQQHTVQEGSSINVLRSTEPTPLWEADWRLEAPGIVSFLKLPEDKEAWKVLPAQTDVFAWQQVLSWFDPSWFRNGTTPRIMQPMRDLNGDGIEDVIWSAPKLANTTPGAFGPGPLTPKAAVLVAASGKDGQPLWWFRPQDAAGNASRIVKEPIWCGESLVSVLRSTATGDYWIEAISAKSGESLWRHGRFTVFAPSSAWLEKTSMPDGTTSLVFVGGSQLVVLDAQTGAVRPSPLQREANSDNGNYLSLRPNEPILDARFADLDGDGVTEALLTVQTDGRGIRDIAFSVTQGKPLWEVLSSFQVGAWHQNEPRHSWPLVADLDGDDKPEVILPGIREVGSNVSDGCRVLDGLTGEPRWTRRFPRRGGFSHYKPERFTIGPDLDGDGSRELFRASIRSEFGPRMAGQIASHHYEEYFLYVDCFSGRDGRSVWWQRTPLGFSEYAAWAGTIGEMLLWGDVTRSVSEGLTRNSRAESSSDSLADASGYIADGLRLVIPVHRHPDTQQDGGTHSIYLLSATTGRIEHQADDLAFPKLVDWNNDGLDDFAVFVPDDPFRFMTKNYWPDKPSGKFVVLRGSPPEAFRRLDRWTEEQDFDGDGIAEMSKRHDGSMGRMGDYAVLIASGRDGRLMSKWKTEWPETPRHFTVGNVQSFPLPLGDFDGDGLADLLITRDGAFQEFWDWESNPRPIVETGKIPLLMQVISSKTGRRVWGGGEFTVPDAFRPTSADVNSESWMTMRFNRIEPRLTQAVDLDADGRSEVLQMLRLVGYGRSGQPGGGALSERQEPFLTLIDGRSGIVRWFESVTAIMTGEQLAAKFGLPDFIKGGGTHAPGLDHLRIDASTDLNGDGTRDLVLTVPQQLQQGSWLQMVQVHSGRDGKVLWGPKPLEGENFNNNDFNPPIVSDLDGDGRPELVLMAAKQPHVTVLRGDTGEQLWTWKGSQQPNFATPGIAVVAMPVAHAARVRQPDKKIDAREPRAPHCVAVAFNETGSQWNLVLLDHKGQLVETVPCASNQLWSHDLDGDGGEELLRQVGSTITATRGLHEILWAWPLTSQSYGWVSHIERTHDGRVIVTMSGNDSVTLLDGKTGQTLGRTFKSTNTSLNENGRNVDLNRPKLNSAGESPRLLTRVGDGTTLLNHVVSRAVLPTDEDGRYQRSRHVSRDEPNALATSNAGASSVKSSTSNARSAHHAERDGYVEDPRLIRQLPWAPSRAELVGFRLILLKQVTIAVTLSLIVLLTPFWLIRAGVRRRELGRWRVALIVSGVALFAICMTALRSRMFLTEMNGAPWGVQVIYATGGLAILAWPSALLHNILGGEWRRVRWLLGGTLLASIVLATIILTFEMPKKPPEQHYSWHGWWFILLFGAFAVGVLLAAWRGFGPYVRWLWNIVRRKLARHG